MRRLARAAWVIARRDYVATVFSRTFLLFLIGPLLPLLFGGLFGAFAGGDPPRPVARPIRVAGAPGEVRAILQARERLATALGEGWLPPLRAGGGRGRPEDVNLLGGLSRPLLTGPPEALASLRGPVSLLIGEARARRAPAAIATRAVSAPPPDRAADGRHDLARGAQVVLFVLMMILAGMLISNLVEEKSSKVIEVLAAAVPVDAIFAGKLLGMLGVSLTGVAVWGGAAGAAAWALVPHGQIVPPAVGWPMFALLALGYFVALYLLMGAFYLGVGAQAATVREVQTLSLPLTLSQLLFFGLASAGVARPDGPLAITAAIIPWSAPFAMLARAAESPALWPHPIAFAWTALCLCGVVATGARLFRRRVLRATPARL